MRLKLDENLSRPLKSILTALQHDVSTVQEEGLLSQPDSVIANAAQHEERVLLTLDVEFANLKKYPPGSHPGIILFRPRSLGPLAVNRFVEGFMNAAHLEELSRCVVIVEPTRVRVRNPASSSKASTEGELTS